MFRKKKLTHFVMHLMQSSKISNNFFAKMLIFFTDILHMFNLVWTGILWTNSWLQMKSKQKEYSTQAC